MWQLRKLARYYGGSHITQYPQRRGYKRISGLIYFEGMNGCGKTTHALNLQKDFLRMGINCVYMRPRYELTKLLPRPFRSWLSKLTNPGFSSITVQYKSKRELNRSGPLALKVLSIFLLLSYALVTYFVVLWPLSRRGLVVCDRFFFDWFYIPHAKHLSALTRLLPTPNLVFILDSHPSVTYSRLKGQDKHVDQQRYKELREWYLILAKQREFTVIDSSLTFEEAKKTILEHVLCYFKLR